MNREISFDGETYAILASAKDVKDGSEWFGNPIESLQAQRMKYPKGKTFRLHYHILNPRTVKKTQEAFLVIQGRLAVDIYSVKKNLLGTLEAGPGEAIFVYRGGHTVRVLEDFIGYEVKAGQFSFVSEDKSFD